MPDTLVIKDLMVNCRLGVYEWEQEKPQTVRIDLELSIDAAKAAASDDVRETIDYAKLVESVTRHAENRPYHLLETLADSLASRVLAEFETTQVTVRVKKRTLPHLDFAAVEVTRPVRPS